MAAYNNGQAVGRGREKRKERRKKEGGGGEKVGRAANNQL